MYYRLKDLGNKTGLELAQAFATIPANVITLDLSWNGLGGKTGAQLAEAFAAISASVTTLDLSWNALGRRTGSELVEAFVKIPASVTTLNLSCNDLGNRTGSELADVFAAIPATVTTLNLRESGLGRRTGSELAKAFAKIPASVTALNLSCNRLAQRTGSELAEAFAKISVSVSTLDLSENGLGQRTGSELVEAFAAIPATVTRLDLSENGLDSQNDAELDSLLAAIPKTVAHITLYFNGLFTNRDRNKRDELLTRLMPIEQNGRLDLARNGESAFSRAFAPFVSAIRKGGMFIEIGAQILSYLLPSNTKIDVLKKIRDLLPSSKIGDVIHAINQEQTKEQKQSVLIRFIQNNELSINEYKTLYDAVKLIEGLNTHRNPLLDSVLGIKNTDSYQNMLGRLREKAFETLFKEVATQTTNNEKLDLLADAKTSSLFEEHRSNSIFAGAWGRTASKKRIEEQEERLKVEFSI